MKSRILPMGRVSFLRPFARYYANRGNDFAALCDEMEVDALDLTDPDALVPVDTAHQIIDRISDELAEPNLGALIGKEWAETDGPPFEIAKRDAGTLSQFFTNLVHSFGTEATSGRITFKVEGAHATVSGRRTYRPGPAARHGSAMYNSFLLVIIKNAVGKDWAEDSVLVQTPDKETVPTWLLAPGRIHTTVPDRHMIRFPAQWCNATPVFPYPEEVSVHPTPDPIQDNIVQTLRRMILDYGGTGRLTLKQAANQLNIPTRSLQRILNRQGVQFGALSREVRLEAAREKLCMTAYPVRQIAEQHGYCNPANFSRDFKKHFGSCPSELRHRK